MMRLFCIRLCVTIFCLALTGCGSSESYVYTGTTGNVPSPPPPPATRVVTVLNELPAARALEPNLTSLQFFGVDQNGATVFDSGSLAPAPSMEVDVPTTVDEFRIAYMNAAGAIVGIYQQDLPPGDRAVVIDDPDYIDLNAFILSIAINPTAFSLELGQEANLTISARLSNGTAADLTSYAALVSSAPDVAPLDVSSVSGLSLGDSEIGARILNKSAAADVTVVNVDGTVAIRFPDGSSVEEGRTLQLQAVRTVDEVETMITDEVDWSSQSEGIARVDDQGQVTGVAEGQAEIRVYDAATDEAAAVTVTVLPVFSLGLLSSVDGIVPGDLSSGGGSISADGRYVAFASNATNLVNGDTNGRRDVFLKNRHTGQVTLLSKRSDGTQSEANTGDPTISRDGRYVTFESLDDLAVGVDTNGVSDVYLYDLQERELELISIAADGQSVGNDSSFHGTGLSGNGRYVVFGSLASNLVDPAPQYPQYQVYLRDRDLGETEMISVTTAGANLNVRSLANNSMVSENGRFVTFTCEGNLEPAVANSNQYNAFFRDRSGTGTTTMINKDTTGTSSSNGPCDVTWMSPDGASMVFWSSSSNLLAPAVTPYEVGQVFRYTRATAEVELLTTDSAGQPLLSMNCNTATMDDSGRFLLFQVLDPAQVMLRDLSSGDYRTVSCDDAGEPAAGRSAILNTSLTPDGTQIVFTSNANNLAVQAVVTAVGQLYATLNPFLVED